MEQPILLLCFNLSLFRSEHENGNDAQEKKHLQFLLFLLLLNALLYTTITSVITFESIMNVDEGNNIRVVNPQKGKCKQDPGPMQATALEW